MTVLVFSHSRRVTVYRVVTLFCGARKRRRARPVFSWQAAQHLQQLEPLMSKGRQRRLKIESVIVGLSNPGSRRKVAQFRSILRNHSQNALTPNICTST